MPARSVGDFGSSPGRLFRNDADFTALTRSGWRAKKALANNQSSADDIIQFLSTRSACFAMNHSRHTDSSIFRPLVAWMALLLYAGMCSPLGVGLAMALGLLDRDHRVELQTGAHEVRVVLHHQVVGRGHQHGWVARTFTVFATPARSNQPDHVLSFGAVSSVSLAPQSHGTIETSEGLPASHTAPPGLIAANRPVSGCASVHPPPMDDATRRSLRSIVLLI